MDIGTCKCCGSPFPGAWINEQHVEFDCGPQFVWNVNAEPFYPSLPPGLDVDVAVAAAPDVVTPRLRARERRQLRAREVARDSEAAAVPAG